MKNNLIKTIGNSIKSLWDIDGKKVARATERGLAEVEEEDIDKLKENAGWDSLKSTGIELTQDGKTGALITNVWFQYKVSTIQEWDNINKKLLGGNEYGFFAGSLASPEYLVVDVKGQLCEKTDFAIAAAILDSAPLKIYKIMPRRIL